MPTVLTPQCADSVLFITLDSCRYDTFIAAETPALKAVGPVWKAQAPASFTYGSHAAMFVGFTPGDASRREAWVNPKFGKIFKLVGPGFAGKGTELFPLRGPNIIEGFRRRGYTTIGTGAADWFNTATESGRILARDFDQFFFPGNTWSLKQQMDWISLRLSEAAGPVFLFVNVGETHVPYYYEGAPWSPEENPCVPFSEANDRAECMRRQRACLEFTDRTLEPLLDAFAAGTTVVCADHGDCWGEDGLWEHGIHHEKVLEVPLLLRTSKAAGTP